MKLEEYVCVKQAMHKILLITVLIFLVGFLAQAQPELGECDQTVEEVASNQLPKALKNWKKANYREVERYLKKAVSLDPNYADALYLLGDLYVKKMDIKKAEPLWAKALEVCPDYKPELYYFLGSIYLENGRRDKAVESFDKFLSHPDRDRGYEKEVKKARKEALILDKLLENPVRFEPKPVRDISTNEDEYLGVISPDQELLFFTRRSRKVSSRDGPAARTRLVEEFSLAKRNADGKFEKGSPLPNPFNTSFNEGGPTINANNTELYFTVCENLNGYQNCDVYYSERNSSGGWTVPQSIGDHINRRDSWESQPSISANGDVLYFTSNRAGGVGGLDLYQCIRKPDGSWSEPSNVGAPINTRKDEKTPFIHSDSRTIYFTSNGHMGLGGFDIYFARANDEGVWQEPQNIGFPINSKEDDLGLFVSLDGRTGYFASNKLRANMGWDLYAFELPEQVRPEAVALISGTLTDEDAFPDTAATLEIKNLKTRDVTKVDVDKETGNYARVVTTKPNEDLILTVKKKGAAFSSKYISANEMSRQVIKAPLTVKPLEVGKEYKLNDINFGTNSYALDGASKAVIDEFILFLEENPNLKADIQGHTDNVGNDNDNLVLSKNRAKTVYDYVIAKGVSAARLSHHGYGETRPIAGNDTETGRASNRRTVFVITSR
jgi:outer membrane protein OmpA-like peptidoglycan-associated protein/tetratricopeptide (TPR) repeat protein